MRQIWTDTLATIAAGAVMMIGVLVAGGFLAAQPVAPVAAIELPCLEQPLTALRGPASEASPGCAWTRTAAAWRSTWTDSGRIGGTRPGSPTATVR
jgi:hypothetical protein